MWSTVHLWWVCHLLSQPYNQLCLNPWTTLQFTSPTFSIFMYLYSTTLSIYTHQYLHKSLQKSALCLPKCYLLHCLLASYTIARAIATYWSWDLHISGAFLKPMMLGLSIANSTSLQQVLWDRSNKAFKGKVNFKSRNDGIKSKTTVHTLINNHLPQCFDRLRLISFKNQPFRWRPSCLNLSPAVFNKKLSSFRNRSFPMHSTGGM